MSKIWPKFFTLEDHLFGENGQKKQEDNCRWVWTKNDAKNVVITDAKNIAIDDSKNVVNCDAKNIAIDDAKNVVISDAKNNIISSATKASIDDAKISRLMMLAMSSLKTLKRRLWRR